jgi:hypothetical protein
MSEWAERIRNAKDLWDLHVTLCAFEDSFEWFELKKRALAAEGIDILALPVFGGEEPDSTHEIWSWDEHHVLAGGAEPFRDWRIEARGATGTQAAGTKTDRRRSPRGK